MLKARFVTGILISLGQETSAAWIPARASSLPLIVLSARSPPYDASLSLHTRSINTETSCPLPISLLRFPVLIIWSKGRLFPSCCPNLSFILAQAYPLTFRNPSNSSPSSLPKPYPRLPVSFTWSILHPPAGLPDFPTWHLCLHNHSIPDNTVL